MHYSALRSGMFLCDCGTSHETKGRAESCVLGKLRAKAAEVLDKTHDVDGRGPKTFEARRRVAHFADTLVGSRRQIRTDIRWLESKAREVKGDE